MKKSCVAHSASSTASMTGDRVAEKGVRSSPVGAGSGAAPGSSGRSAAATAHATTDNACLSNVEDKSRASIVSSPMQLKASSHVSMGRGPYVQSDDGGKGCTVYCYPVR